MSRRELEKVLALSRSGDVAGALERMAPKTRGTRSVAKRIAGAAANRSGADFQHEIRESLRLEADAGRCVWNEGNPRVRGRPGAMFPVEKATVDFQLLADLVPIAWDCKTFSQHAEYSIAMIGDPREIERHRRQIEWLQEFRKHGGIAFVLLYEPKRDRAWLCFSLQTLAAGEPVKVRTIEREQRGIPARVIDHLPALEPNPRLTGPRWRILDAALAHGLKTLPLNSPFRKG